MCKNVVKSLANSCRIPPLFHPVETIKINNSRFRFYAYPFLMLSIKTIFGRVHIYYGLCASSSYRVQYCCYCVNNYVVKKKKKTKKNARLKNNTSSTKIIDLITTRDLHSPQSIIQSRRVFRFLTGPGFHFFFFFSFVYFVLTVFSLHVPARVKNTTCV